MKLLVINGPNLNMLGKREPEIYGHISLADIEKLCEDTAKVHGASAICFQSNSEGEIVTRIQQALGKEDAIVINAGAYTHTSVAIHDALRSVGLPVMEVHISNIYQREEFRHISYVSPVAKGVICGLGIRGYKAAIEALVASNG